MPFFSLCLFIPQYWGFSLPLLSVSDKREARLLRPVGRLKASACPVVSWNRAVRAHQATPSKGIGNREFFEALSVQSYCTLGRVPPHAYPKSPALRNSANFSQNQ